MSRRDGTDVGIEEWRTGKTRDLLRLLALADERPMRQDQLTELLWPDVPGDIARNRLRTAASQIRMTLNDRSVVRQPDGLVLTGVLLDAHQFAAMAQRVAEASARGDFSAVLPIARAAERLYRDDFRADDDDSTWAVEERSRLRQLRRTLACDAAESALAERKGRDALEFATLAVHLDPLAETGQRLLMRAHAAMGEIAAALRDFEQYRRRLRDELGVDPSPETQALHVELLRSTKVGRQTG